MSSAPVASEDPSHPSLQFSLNPHPRTGLPVPSLDLRDMGYLLIWPDGFSVSAYFCSCGDCPVWLPWQPFACTKAFRPQAFPVWSNLSHKPGLFAVPSCLLVRCTGCICVLLLSVLRQAWRWVRNNCWKVPGTSYRFRKNLSQRRIGLQSVSSWHASGELRICHSWKQDFKGCCEEWGGWEGGGQGPTLARSFICFDLNICQGTQTRQWILFYFTDDESETQKDWVKQHAMGSGFRPAYSVSCTCPSIMYFLKCRLLLFWP